MISLIPVPSSVELITVITAIFLQGQSHIIPLRNVFEIRAVTHGPSKECSLVLVEKSGKQPLISRQTQRIMELTVDG